MSELRKLDTKYNYNSELVEGNEVYIKVKLLERLTYGEYIGEPENGFSVALNDKGETTAIDLDRCEVYVKEEG